MSKTSCCTPAMEHAETDATRLFVAEMARGAAAAWRDFLFLVDSALLPIAWIVTTLRSWDSKARRMALWSSLSDHDLRDVGLPRGGAEFLTCDPDETRAVRPAPRFE